jgi:hypothetical protein
MTAVRAVTEPDVLAEILAEVRELRSEVAAISGRPAPAVEPGLVDASTLAHELGVSRAFVYENRERLGGVRIGDGSRPRLRFDLKTARAALDAAEPKTQIPHASARRRTSEPRRPTSAGAILAVRPRSGR